MTDRAGSEARLRAAIAAALSDGGEGIEPIQRLCEACAEALPVDGVSIAVMTGDDHDGTVTVYASDPVIDAVEEAQFTLGEGPCFEAFQTGRPVLVPDLATAPVGDWPVFAATIGGQPIAAVFAFPVTVGAIHVGALDMYRRAPGPLSAGDLSHALRVADVVAVALLGLRAGGSGDRPAPGWLEVVGSGHRAEVYQATGMIAGALSIPAEQGLARLRGHAFAAGRSIGQVAHDIVTWQLLPEELEP